jgi:uncharacterized protein YjbI with pentapeptide repeats
MKTKIQIKSVLGSLLFEYESEDNSIKKTVIEAVKQGANLRGANLRGADLRGAYLRCAYLLGANLRDANLRGANLQDADLRDANLRGANLWGANLWGANLRGADLRGADLQGANLRGANLRGANLWGANLRGADLQDADLRDANLRGANLWGANLWGANLRGADLWGANLQGANLRDADLRGAKNADYAIAQTRILPEGDIIGWKKCRNGVIVKLLIPKEAKRSHAFERKCRAEFADVLEVIGDGPAISGQKDDFVYEVGKRVTPDKWDDNWQDECSHGIHFFITRIEAENY